MKRVVRKTLGIIFIVLGFLALITPFTPGSWLILVGLEILGLRMLIEKKLSAFLSDSQRKKLQNLKCKIKNLLYRNART
jgi:uncharacterized protein YqgC (DUF456 family)